MLPASTTLTKYRSWRRFIQGSFGRDPIQFARRLGSRKNGQLAPAAQLKPIPLPPLELAENPVQFDLVLPIPSAECRKPVLNPSRSNWPPACRESAAPPA